VLFKTFDEGKNVLGANFADLSSFITKHSVPLIDEIGPDNYKNYAEAGIPLAYLFVALDDKDTYIDRVRAIAESSKGKLNWVYIDTAKYARHAEKLGLSGQKFPALAIENMENGLHWAFDEAKELSTETIKEWIGTFLENKLDPTIKSEPIPEPNDAPVKILVAKNFDQIVNDNTKDVFVEFYAPWCGHCKKLAPIYDELGQAFGSAPSVVIAKIDATANDVDAKLGIRGFPTIKFFPANNKAAPLDYNGDRSLADMINFIKSNAATEVNVATPESKDEL
jgi:protein disulfide-isomerase A1